MRPNLDLWPAPVYSTKIRVYFEDTDAGGIVYHANYLRFMERARSDWLRKLGVSHRELAQNEHVVLVVRDAKIEFMRPARIDDELLVDVRLNQVKRASIVFGQTIFAAPAQEPIVGRESSAELLVSGEIRVAALSARDGKVAAIPQWLMEKIER